MAQTKIKTARIDRALREYTSASIRDNKRTEQESFDRLKGELCRRFAATEFSYQPLTAADVIMRNTI